MVRTRRAPGAIVAVAALVGAAIAAVVVAFGSGDGATSAGGPVVIPGTATVESAAPGPGPTAGPTAPGAAAGSADDVFVAQLAQQEIALGPAAMSRVVQPVCRGLGDGADLAAVHRQVQREAPDLDPAQVESVTAAVVGAYCPEFGGRFSGR